MKKVTLRDATDEQIINAIRSNPEKWGLELSRETQVTKAMENSSYIDAFSEAVHMYDEWDNVGWYEDEDGDKCIDWESEKTKCYYYNYVDSSMDGWDEFVDIDYADIEVHRTNDYLHIEVFWDDKMVGESWYTNPNIFNREIELKEGLEYWEALGHTLEIPEKYLKEIKY